EDVVRAAVPEVAQVEHSVDYARRVARGDLADVEPTEGEQARRAGVCPHITGAIVGDVDECPFYDARRPYDLATLARRRGSVVVRIRERVKRKVADCQRGVRAHGSRRGGGVGDLVCETVIRAGMKVTRRARGAPVA